MHKNHLTPKIIWASPPPVRIGELLTKDHMNAKILMVDENEDEDESDYEDDWYESEDEAGDEAEDNAGEDEVVSPAQMRIDEGIKLQEQEETNYLDEEYLLNNNMGQLIYRPELGTRLPVGTHTIHVVYKPFDEKNYGGATASIEFTVMPFYEEVLWEPPKPIYYPQKLGPDQLRAHCPTQDGTFVYAPAREDDPLPVGIHTISVQFWPYNHVQYGVVNKQVQIQVLKRTPSIEWPTPPVMYVGDNLSYEIHLNAVCVFMKRSDVPDLTGVFRYTHDPYSFLNPAHHEIKCTFQPDDMDNYTLAEASVTQTVRCKPKIKWSNVPILRIGNIISEQHLCARCSDCSGNFQYDPCVGEEANAGGKRTFRVVFTPDDNTIYDTVEHKIVIDVLPKLQPQLTWDPPVVSYGNMLTAENALCCTSDQPGYFVYDGDGVPPSFKLSPELESYIERKERGEISEEEEGKLILDSGKYVIQVNFVPAEGDTYAPASLAVNLTIERLVVELDYGPFEDIYYGDFIDKDKHLSAKITGIALDFLPPYDEASGGMSPIIENSSFGTFSYNLVAGELLKAGTHDAVVTYEPNDKKNFSTAVVTVPLKVKRHEPEVVWPTMKPITYSTLLSEKQLCATVKPNTRGINETIAGELTYSWNIGHRFAKVGRHPISCTFTHRGRLQLWHNARGA